jgi:hypothetical protein
MSGLRTTSQKNSVATPPQKDKKKKADREEVDPAHYTPSYNIYIYVYIYIYTGRVKGMWSLHTTSRLMTGTTSGVASKVVAAAERLRGPEAALLQLAVAAPLRMRP